MSEFAAGPVGARRLVVCCDGTWNSADRGQRATNVLRLARIVEPWTRENGTAQIVYYDTGVGTGNWFDRLVGGGTGVGLSHNVRDAYAFLVNNYAPGDEIFLFGFSRGAYTARCVAGLIGTIGLMRDRDMGGFQEAWGWYRLPPAARRMEDLDRRFPNRARDVRIRCLGVWDTVGSLGIPANRWLRGWHPCEQTYAFYDVTLGTHVDHAFQALAIDEKRLAFKPAVWRRNPAAPATQKIKQVWFPGVHSDVGGGYQEHGVSDLAFLWMVAQVAPLLHLDLAGLREELDREQRYGAGRLHETFEGVWKKLGRFDREFGTGAEEFLHESVRLRGTLTGYQPGPNFRRADLPLEPFSDLEHDYAWQETQTPPAPGQLAQRKSSFCDRLVHFLGGG